MNIQANSLQNMNRFTANKPNITNISEIMSQAKDKMVSVSRRCDNKIKSCSTKN